MLLRSIITEAPISFPEDYDLLENEIISIAKRQEITHLLYYGYKKQNRSIPKELVSCFHREIYRDSHNFFLLEQMKQCFDNAGIIYVPIKGIVNRELYPEFWMRTGCDVDVLIHEQDLVDAVQVLTKAGFTTDNRQEFHDISLYYYGALLELHYNICENIPRLDAGLSEVWDYIEQKQGYEYRETPEFQIFHNFAHMLYHFVRGGCRIKAFMDLWLMRNTYRYDDAKLHKLLSKCRLEQFYDTICEIMENWFGENEPTELSQLMASYVFAGGLPGSIKDIDIVDVALSGNSFKYMWSSAFLPMSEMTWRYPKLKKYPALLPYFYGKRIVSKLIGKDREKTQQQLKEARKYNKEDAEELTHLIEQLKL